MRELKSIEEFQVEKNKGKTIFFFTADWCGDCVYIKPVMPEIEAAHPDFTFIQVDRDEFIDLCGELSLSRGSCRYWFDGSGSWTLCA